MFNKKRSFVFISLMLLLIVSLGTLYATDNETTSSSSTDSESYTSTETTSSNTFKEDVGSFSDLDNIIQSSNYEVNLDRDYSFNKLSDKNFSKGINIIKPKLIINGNNHTIDACNSSLFNLYETSFELSNLTIKNANSSTITGINSSILTSNVIFENNYNTRGGAINVFNSEYASVLDTFKDNYAESGAAIYAYNSTINILNSKFSSKNDLTWGMITAYDTTILIKDTTFKDIKSNYTTAVNGVNISGIITNSTFMNLHSKISAGALAFKNINNTIMINDCTFINVTSKKNAGAIFVDVEAQNYFLESPPLEGVIVIDKSIFSDCRSDYGGAILQLGGTLNINNTSFMNNYANYNGGAIYTSYCLLNVNNSIFNKNYAKLDNLGCGGAIYFDLKNLTVSNTVFMENDALEGGAIYIYDSNYIITESYFEDNNENIHSVFDSNITICDDSNIFDNGENKFNQSEYLYVYEGIGEKMPINPMVLDENLINASRFDLRDYGLIPPVRNQGYMGACWTFGAAGALESAILRATNKSLKMDISENNIKNNALIYSKHGTIYSEGGFAESAGSYFTSWLGIVSSEDDTYDELGKIGHVMENGSKYHIYKFKFLPIGDKLNISVYKEALVKYGAISTMISGDFEKNYNEKTYAHYNPNATEDDINHEINIVGWDDNFSKSNFLVTPPGDGAWIMRNSWGSNWADGGYYYLSYYDAAHQLHKTPVVYIIDDNYDFERNYQYDPISYVNLTGKNGSDVRYANTYEAISDDLIAAVGTFFNESQPYNLSITTNRGSYNQSGVSEYYGYNLIELNQYVPVKKSENFTISITSTTAPITLTRNNIPANSSMSDCYGNWTDLRTRGRVAILKAYTISDNSKVLVEDMTTKYASGEYLRAQFIDEHNQTCSNTTIKYKVNGKTFNATSDEDGFIHISTDLPVGKYIVSLYNPVSGEEVNVTLTIESSGSKSIKQKYSLTPHKNIRNHEKIIKTYRGLVKNNEVYKGKYITIDTLNKIFNVSFTNGHLTVYLDGILIFNDTVGNDTARVILEILERFLGTHEIKIEFTDHNNNTQTYIENITLT